MMLLPYNAFYCRMGGLPYFWSGVTQREAVLRRRLDDLVGSLRRTSVYVEVALPSFFCFVGSDLWQVEVCRLAVQAQGLSERFYGITRDLVTDTGAIALLPSTGWVVPHVNVRDVSYTYGLDKLLAGFYWSRHIPRPQMQASIIDLVAQWPGITSGRVAKLLEIGSPRESRAVLHVSAELCEAGLLQSVGNNSRDRFVLSPSAQTLS